MLLILPSHYNLKQEETFKFATEIEIKVWIYMARRRARKKKESPLFKELWNAIDRIATIPEQVLHGEKVDY